MNNLSYVEKTEIQYIKVGSWIKLPNGKIKRRLFGLIEESLYDFWEIKTKGSRYGSVMTVLLENKYGEQKTIEISPYRTFEYWVEEKW